MSKGVLNGEALEKLLNWLNTDQNKASEKYESIRLRLIRIFSCRGCCDSEDLADETIDVVAAQIDRLRETYKGDPALYFYGVAKKKILEYNKKKPPPPPRPPPDVTEIERKCYCLENCLKRLPETDQRLVLRYHEKEKKEKIILRKQLAAELAISINALRIKVHHIHARLRPCIEQCLQHLVD
jgi:hypothetical protein